MLTSRGLLAIGFGKPQPAHPAIENEIETIHICTLLQCIHSHTNSLLTAPLRTLGQKFVRD